MPSVLPFIPKFFQKDLGIDYLKENRPREIQNTALSWSQSNIQFEKYSNLYWKPHSYKNNYSPVITKLKILSNYHTDKLDFVGETDTSLMKGYAKIISPILGKKACVL